MSLSDTHIFSVGLFVTLIILSAFGISLFQFYKFLKQSELDNQEQEIEALETKSNLKTPHNSKK